MWFALRIQSNKEALAHAALTEAGITSLFPHFLVQERRKGRRGQGRTYYRQDPILVGYALAAHDGSDLWWRRIASLEWPRSGKRLALSIVGMEGRPVPIPESAIAHLAGMCNVVIDLPQPKPIEAGARARILAGSLAGLEVDVAEVTETRAKVLLRLLGSERTITTTLDKLEAA